MSVNCSNSMVFSGYSGFLHQKNWLSWYKCNIVESGIKHHNPNPNISLPSIIIFINIVLILGNWPIRTLISEQDRLYCKLTVEKIYIIKILSSKFGSITYKSCVLIGLFWSMSKIFVFKIWEKKKIKQLYHIRNRFILIIYKVHTVVSVYFYCLSCEPSLYIITLLLFNDITMTAWSEIGNWGLFQLMKNWVPYLLVI